MRRAIIVTLAAFIAGASLGADPAAAASLGRYEVFGVDDDDLLKMRSGPGVDYKVIVGLPNGAVLRVHNCTQTGGTRWCSVSLQQARGLKGFVSWAYLRKL